MNDQLDKTKDILEQLSRNLNSFIADNISDNWFLLVVVKLALLVAIIWSIDLFLKFAFRFITAKFSKEDNYPFLKALHESKVVNSLAHIFALLFGSFAMVPIFQYVHPKSFAVFEEFWKQRLSLHLQGWLYVSSPLSNCITPIKKIFTELSL